MTTGMIHIYSIGNLRIFILSYTQTRGETAFISTFTSTAGVTTEIRPRYCGISAALLRNFSRIIIPSGMPRSPSPRRSIRAGWRGMKIFSYFCVPIGGGLRLPKPPPGMGQTHYSDWQ